jgi:hypothetical protein
VIWGKVIWASESARKAGKALRAVPPEWRDNPAFEAFASAWQDGWREADGEAAK